MTIEIVLQPAVYTQFFDGEERKAQITLTDDRQTSSRASLDIVPGDQATEQFFQKAFEQHQKIVATFFADADLASAPPVVADPAAGATEVPAPTPAPTSTIGTTDTIVEAAE